MVVFLEDPAAKSASFETSSSRVSTANPSNVVSVERMKKTSKAPVFADELFAIFSTV